jgi:phosphoribosylaminoimidazole carboxylase (NCAIR synthetase)
MASFPRIPASPNDVQKRESRSSGHSRRLSPHSEIKLRRWRWRSLGVEVVPGSANSLTSPDEAASVAEAIGYPVMVKAAAGGGGRGMRVVTNSDEMVAAFARSESEAKQLSATARFLSKNYSRVHAISKSRFWPTLTAASSICTSAIARCSCATKRLSRSRLPRTRSRAAATAPRRRHPPYARS